MRNNNTTKNNFFYGNIAGIITGISLQPLEVLKMNMILLPKKDLELKMGTLKNKSCNIFVNTKLSGQYIYQQEGIKGFYRGLSPALIKASFSSGIYFSLMRKIEKNIFYINNKFKIKNENSIHFIGSAIARSISSLIMNPITIIKTRAEVIGNNDYSSLFTGLNRIYKKEGLKAFFKGGLAILVRDFPFGGIFNLTYEKLNKLTKNKNNIYFLINGLIAGVIATTFTQPIEIVRAQLQFDKTNEKFSWKKSKILIKLNKIYQVEGIKGFEKGLIPRLIRKPLANALTFYLYELQNKIKNK